ncbi:MAG: HAD family phosphatase [Clostridia bacterium]|nr:HAD family phosphatase [Clostridia bacterium]
MFKGKQIIIFDMDGTLIDSIGAWNKIDMELIRELGGLEELNEIEIQKQRDNKLREFSKSENPYIEYCDFLSSKYDSGLTGEETLKKRYDIAQNYLKNEIDYKEDVPELLKLLKDKNYTLVIASTTRRKNMDIYCNENTNIISKANIKDYFSIVYTREDAKEIKPNPEIYLRILNELKARKEQCLIFEDSLIGIEAASNAGIEVVAMYDKYSDIEREEINKKATYNFNNYREVIQTLLKENL